MSPSRIARPARTELSRGEAAAAEYFQRAEVRDVLAWVRLLVDPHDAAAVVRALARPPIELRQTHLARVIQFARRRKLDLVSGLSAATESPQIAPEARERIERFIELHDSAAALLDGASADVFIAELIELLSARLAGLLPPEEAAEQRAHLEQLRRLAEDFAGSEPASTPRQLARYLAVVAPEAPAVGAPSALPAPSPDRLQETFAQLREEVLASVARIGGRLHELRLDTELDIAHGVVGYLELIKLSALLQRSPADSAADALADINSRLLAATTPVQREILQTSTLDEALIAATEFAASDLPGGGPPDATLAGAARARRAPNLPQREEHSLEPFLPRKGIGLAMSASDIQTYRSCPLRYKFARVLRIPTEQTLHQRFGIAVHQVLERYHGGGGQTLEQLLSLLDAGWRRSGLGDGERERRLFELARVALSRYHERLQQEHAEPVWFERSFSVRLGPHHLRGRVDRVDLLAPDDSERYELIDYKTSRPKTPSELQDDIQLSLYALAAREAWGLESSRQAYYYVLDDLKVPVPVPRADAAKVADTVREVGAGILAQRFEPTPSPATCSICDYRIVCPVAET